MRVFVNLEILKNFSIWKRKQVKFITIFTIHKTYVPINDLVF